MKIGILTFHNAMNYGAVLQAYALQKAVEQVGGICEIIDYQHPDISRPHRKLRDVRSFRKLIRFICFNRYEVQNNKVFSEFENIYIHKSLDVYNRHNIESAGKLHDKFVVGSDQVWNLSLTDEDYTYFLDFLADNKKKYAYAASFGYSKIPEPYLENCTNLLRQFNRISTREEQGAKIVQQLTDRKAETVLDPTLLLTREQWEQFACRPNIKEVNDKYILLYLITPQRHNYRFARQLAKETGLKILYVCNSLGRMLGATNIRYASPNEIVWLVSHAEYVVTNSFHGSAFSINLNKTFYYELSREKINANSRIESIVKKLGLKDREIDSDRKDIQFKAIKWESVNKRLQMEREKSINYLKGIINE